MLTKMQSLSLRRACCASQPPRLPIRRSFPCSRRISPTRSCCRTEAGSSLTRPTTGPMCRSRSRATSCTGASSATRNTGKRRDALPKLGSWAKQGFTWAPEVLRARRQVSALLHRERLRRNAQCIGVAVASDALGPFVDDRTEPIVCQTGARRKHRCGRVRATPTASSISTSRTTGTGSTRAPRSGASRSRPTACRSPASRSSWSRTTRAGRSGSSKRRRWSARRAATNCSFPADSSAGIRRRAGCRPTRWAMRAAPARSAPAPRRARIRSCTASPTARRAASAGPGHQSIFTVGARSFISFHAWQATSSCRKVDNRRYLYIAPLFWKDGKPQIGPSLR